MNQFNDIKIAFMRRVWINLSTVDEKRSYYSESKVILTAGRFMGEKGFDLLLGAAGSGNV